MVNKKPTESWPLSVGREGGLALLAPFPTGRRVSFATCVMRHGKAVLISVVLGVLLPPPLLFRIHHAMLRIETIAFLRKVHRAPAVTVARAGAGCQ